MNDYIWALGDKLATWAVNSRVPSWACLAVAWLAALYALPYMADEIGSRTLFWVIGVAVLVGYWPSVLHLIGKARDDGAYTGALRAQTDQRERESELRRREAHERARGVKKVRGAK
jgi:hypothetical protein